MNRICYMNLELQFKLYVRGRGFRCLSFSFKASVTWCWNSKRLRFTNLQLPINQTADTTELETKLSPIRHPQVGPKTGTYTGYIFRQVLIPTFFFSALLWKSPECPPLLRAHSCLWKTAKKADVGSVATEKTKLQVFVCGCSPSHTVGHQITKKKKKIKAAIFNCLENWVWRVPSHIMWTEERSQMCHQSYLNPGRLQSEQRRT